MKHIVCYSGGHSSALVAVEVVRRFGREQVVLLNHDIHSRVEDADIKRFKLEVAEHLSVPITYANYRHVEEWDQFDICMAHSAFKLHDKPALCTHRLKTEPFQKYLAANFPGGEGCVIYYGFDRGELKRVQRRSSILAAQGYRSDYPLALWEKRTINSTLEIGIEPPLTYSQFKHANCVGCLKAGRQHWYVVYCVRPDIFTKAKRAEEEIGYTIINGVSLLELEPLFVKMKCAGVEASEKVPQQRFWADVKKLGLEPDEGDIRPCECAT